jgi:hypothetical protein
MENKMVVENKMDIIIERFSKLDKIYKSDYIPKTLEQLIIYNEWSKKNPIDNIKVDKSISEIIDEIKNEECKYCKLNIPNCECDIDSLDGSQDEQLFYDKIGSSWIHGKNKDNRKIEHVMIIKLLEEIMNWSCSYEGSQFGLKPEYNDEYRKFLNAISDIIKQIKLYYY